MAMSGEGREKRSKEAIARDYLGKIVQLPLRILPSDQAAVAAFIRDMLMPVTSPDIDSDPGQTKPVTNTKKVTTPNNPAEPSIPPEPGQPDASLDEAQESTSQSQAMAPPDGAETSQQAMTFSQPEQTLFIELCHILDLTNPRQLTRLRNAYLLLKRLLFEQKKQQGEAMDQAPMLQQSQNKLLALCWTEYLYQCDGAQRRQHELAFWQIKPTEQAAQQIRQRFEAIAGDFAENYVSLMDAVNMVVLPNAEQHLLRSAKEAEDYAKINHR